MNYSTQHAEIMALKRISDALERAEYEEPLLTCPDGTAAINIVDLRSFMTQFERMRDSIAMGQSDWKERWNGSEPERGSSIWTDVLGSHGVLLAYFGGDDETHKTVSKLVMMHNAILRSSPLANKTDCRAVCFVGTVRRLI